MKVKIAFSQMAFVLTLLMISGSVHAQSSALQRKDSLSNLSYTHFSAGPETYYLFDSLFVVNQKDFQRFRLNRVATLMTIVLTTSDSSIVYVPTERVTLLNGRIVGDKKHWVSVSRCNKARVRPISASRLKSGFGIDHGKGGFVITCE